MPMEPFPKTQSGIPESRFGKAEAFHCLITSSSPDMTRAGAAEIQRYQNALDRTASAYQSIAT
jgi:hypothetical protein